MELYRLTPNKYGRVLSGRGAALSGARWNSAGTEMIYTSSSRSLAMAEVLVHLTLVDMPVNFMMMTITVPDHLRYLEILPKDLPAGWNQFPLSKTTQKIGDKFISGEKSCLLKVPSVVTKGDFNYLINPAHPEFASIIITGYEPFPFDNRLFGS